MQGLLDFDQSPPFLAPVRFFLAAPLFGVLAGLLVAVSGGELFVSRWHPGLLALTHLATLGFMLQVMLGALIQVLPVVAGVNLPHPLWLSRALLPLLSGGTLLLAAGFLWSDSRWLHAGGGLVLLGVLLFLACALPRLLRATSTSPTIAGIKLSLLGLGGVIGLGFFLIHAITQGTAWSLPALTDLHAAWGLGAWAGVLLGALACVVVPMFQLTPGYPARPSWHWPRAVLAVALLWGGGVAAGNDAAGRLAGAALALLGLAFAALTLRLQAQRRRARADATFRYWQFGLGCGALAMLQLLSGVLVPTWTAHAAWAPVFGILLIGGGFVSLMVGMLYKIIPFLAWMHLQHAGQGRVLAPNMSKLLAEQRMQRQFRVHVSAILGLLAAAVGPGWLALPAGLLLAGAQAWLGHNLLHAVANYRRHLALIAGATAAAA